MPSYLLRLTDDRVTPPKDHYFLWSTIIDAPTAVFDDLKDLKTSMTDAYGPSSVSNDRIDRLLSKGTSSYHRETPDQIVSCNRAGLDETRLSVHQLIDVFVHDMPNVHGEIYVPETDTWITYAPQ